MRNKIIPSLRMRVVPRPAGQRKIMCLNLESPDHEQNEIPRIITLIIVMYPY